MRTYYIIDNKLYLNSFLKNPCMILSISQLLCLAWQNELE
jgi:hypothetical protein